MNKPNVKKYPARVVVASATIVIIVMVAATIGFVRYELQRVQNPEITSAPLHVEKVNFDLMNALIAKEAARTAARPSGPAAKNPFIGLPVAP